MWYLVAGAFCCVAGFVFGWMRGRTIGYGEGFRDGGCESREAEEAEEVGEVVLT